MFDNEKVINFAEKKAEKAARIGGRALKTIQEDKVFDSSPLQSRSEQNDEGYMYKLPGYNWVRNEDGHFDEPP